jgi:hypothetical protein
MLQQSVNLIFAVAVACIVYLNSLPEQPPDAAAAGIIDRPVMDDLRRRNDVAPVALRTFYICPAEAGLRIDVGQLQKARS